MKRKICALFLLLALCVPLCVVPAGADALWSEDYYRAFDSSDQLSDAEVESLDESCIEFMKQHRVDIAVLAVTAGDWDRVSGREQAKDYFDECRFGYGENADGFLWIYNVDTEEMKLFCFGAADGMIPQDYIDFAAEKAPEMLADYGLKGVLYGGVGYLSKYLEDQAGDAQQSASGGDSSAERAADGSVLPSWYPASTENFPFFHDEAAPRIVDNADIFTDEEEAAMEARIGEIRRELQRDVVVYTDVTDYGLGHAAMAEDFYDYNGYGYGDEAEGMCLFIDMDPENRGWWASATGSESESLYSEYVANLIDDVLYEYMAAGEYGSGVANWIENIRTLYVKGTPFAPDWYGEGTQFSHDPSSPRVVDDAGLLSEAEVAALTEQAAEIAQARGVDVAVHTMASPVGMNYSEVCEQYYRYMGYGYGDNYDGILLTVLKREGYYAVARITAFGAAADKLTETNKERLCELCEAQTNEHAYYEGMSRWLSQTDHMLRTGRVARSGGYWAVIAAIGSVIGSIFGGVSLGVAKAKMAPPRESRDADAYFDPATSRIRDAGSHFLYTTTTRHYDPPQQKSSGGGSSGRSSYHSSHSGSSGRSHSGSGRRF